LALLTEKTIKDHFYLKRIIFFAMFLDIRVCGPSGLIGELGRPGLVGSGDFRTSYKDEEQGEGNEFVHHFFFNLPMSFIILRGSKSILQSPLFDASCG
jgi:hypothetical protein